MNNLINKICFLLFFFGFEEGLIAQTFVPITKITNNQSDLKNKLVIGDKLPDIYLAHITNYSEGKANLYDLRGKLTILDFWSSSCSSCIDLFPHMQQMRDQFKDQLQIILVNGKSALVNDDEAKIKAILTKVGKRTGTIIKLPIIYNCNVLDNYFPYVKIPEEVWINDKGIIVGITGPAEVNSNNIKSILDGRDIHMRYKNDSHIDLGKQTLNELLYGNDQILNKPLFTSTLLKGMIDGVNGTGIRRNEKGNIYGFYIVNQPLLSLYRSAYRNIINCPDNQIVFENVDSSLFKKLDFMDTALYSQLYSYDLTAPAGEIKDLLQYMQSDLEKFFHLSVTTEKRELKCYVIQVPINPNTISTAGGEAVWETKAPTKYIRNYPVNQVLSELNRVSTVPLIDETGMIQNIDMKLPENLENTNEIIDALKGVGFEVKEEIREMDMVIIRDKH